MKGLQKFFNPNSFIRNYQFTFVIIVYLTGSSQCKLFGQEASNPTTDTTLTFNEIVVSATRHNIHSQNIPYSISVLTQAQLNEFQFRTTPEALNGTTGVFIQKTNHGGGSAFIRGLTGNQTLTMIDGIRLNNPTFRYGPNQYLNTVDPYSLAKIEVVRGTGSVQYGSDAMGGIIHLFTKDPSLSDSTQWKIGISGKAVSQNMEYSGRSDLEFQSKNIGFRIGATLRSFGDLLAGKSTGFQRPSGYDEKSLDSKLKWKINDQFTITGAYQSTNQNDVPLYHKVQLENFDYYFFDPQSRQLGYLKVGSKRKNKWTEKINLISSYQRTGESRKYHQNENNFGYTEVDQVNTFGNTIDILSNASDQWSFNTGIEHYYSKVLSSRKKLDLQNKESSDLRGLYPNDASTHNFSIYSMHHYFMEKWNFEAGLRYNHFKIAIPNSDPSLAEADEILINPSSLVSNLSAMYSIGSGHSFSVSQSSGYRAPNIDDLGTLGLVDFRYEIPAYDLKPEKSTNIEFSYRYIGRKTSINLSVFQMFLHDLITRTKLEDEFVNGYNVYIKENTQKARIKGFEFAGNFPFSDSWTYQITATYTYGQNLSAMQPMRRIPPFHGRNLIQYNYSSGGIHLEHLFAGKQDRLSSGDIEDNRIGPDGTPGWQVINIYASYRLKSLILRTGVQNLFNEDYRTHGSGINGIGRSAFIAMEYNLLQ